MRRSDFVEYVVHDLLSGVDGIQARAMFGGHGIYRHGVMFAIIVDDQLYFKVGDANKSAYEARGCRPFTYQSSRGRSVAMSYWEVPADILEDREEIHRWADASYRVSQTLRRAAGSGNNRIIPA